MRILYLHQYFATPESDTGIRSYEIARRLVDRGHDVTVVTGDSYLPATWRKSSLVYRLTPRPGLTVIAMRSAYSNLSPGPARLMSFVVYVLFASVVALTRGYDRIFATSTPLTVAAPALLARAVRRRPYVFEVRDLWPAVPASMGFFSHPLLRRSLEELERRAYRSAEHIVALSPDMATAIKQSSGRDAIVAPNAASALQTSSGGRSSAAQTIRRHTEAVRAQGDIALVYAGTIGRANALHTMIPVIRESLKHQVRLHLLVIGDGNAAEELRQAREGVEHLVPMFGRIPKSELVPMLEQADACVSTFDPEIPVLFSNSANKVFDAMSVGTPIVLNHGGWLQDLLDDTGAGTSIYGVSEVVAYQRIVELCRDGRAREASRRLGAEDFSWGRMGPRVVDVIEQTPA